MQPVKTIRHHLIALAVSLIVPALAVAGALPDYAENKLIDFYLRAQTFTPPATQGVALSTAVCSDSGAPTEPDNTYTRQSITAGLAAWAGTQSAGSTTASSGTGGTTSNNAIITWVESTAAWSTGTTLKSVWVMDSTTIGAGNALVCIDLTTPFSVSGAGITIRFPAAALQFSLD